MPQKRVLFFFCRISSFLLSHNMSAFYNISKGIVQHIKLPVLLYIKQYNIVTILIIKDKGCPV